MCNVVTRESTTLMSCQQGGQSKHETSHTQQNGGGALRHRSTSPVLAARLPSRLNSLDKRAVCTTSVEFDVDAAVNDRTMSTCGVSDVLSASPFGVGASSMMSFLPRLSNSHKSEYPSSCLPRCRSRRPGALDGVRCCYTSWLLQEAETIVARRCTCTLCMRWYLRDTDLVSCQKTDE